MKMNDNWVFIGVIIGLTILYTILSIAQIFVVKEVVTHSEALAFITDLTAGVKQCAEQGREKYNK